MSSEEKEIEILRVKLRARELQIRKYETDKERYMTELCEKIDALAEIAMVLGISESQARPLRNTILAKGVIVHKIKQLQARVSKPKHRDKINPRDLQHLPLLGQKEFFSDESSE